MSKVRDSQKRFAFPIQLLDDHKVFAELPSEIYFIPTGDWQHPVYGRMIITSSDITEFKRNFDAGVRKDNDSGYAASLEEMLK